MRRRILSCFISLLSILAAFFPAQAQQLPPAQLAAGTPAATQQKQEEKGDDIPSYPLFNGVDISVDLWGPGSRLFGSDFLSMEAAVDVNLKNRFFPAAEIGYGLTDTWSEKGTHYKSHAPYFRIGADYNAFYKKKFKHKLLVGLRYGFSSFKYDVEAAGLDDGIYGGTVGNPNLEDGIWGGSLPYKHEGMGGTAHWLELNIAIRAHIWKDLYMGWGIRYRFPLSTSHSEYGDPWYIPGYGKYGSKTLGVLYSITYTLPAKR